MVSLPPVNNLLHGRFAQAAARFMSPARRLHIVFPIVCEDAAWARRLDIAFKDFAHCESAVEGNGALIDVLNGCTISGDWQPLFENPAFLWRKHFHLDPQEYAPDDDADPERGSVPRAWRTPYIGNAVHLLSEYLLRINEGKAGASDGLNDKPEYPKIGSVTQSSGTGKSRLLYEYGKLVFTLPFKLRHDARSTDGYSIPTDNQVKWFLEPGYYGCLGSEELEERCLLFFAALLETAAILLQAQVRQQGKFSGAQAAASWWHMHFHRNRRPLYSAVIEQAEGTIRGDSQGVSMASDDARAAMDHLLRVLEAAIETSDPFPVKVVICFDDAQKFKGMVTAKRNSLEELPVLPVVCKALDIFRDSPVVVLFSSTCFNLIYRNSSAHWTEWKGQIFHKPFTNTFSWRYDPFQVPNGRTFTLDELAELSFMARLGRPLYPSLIVSGESPELVLDLAKRKLQPQDPDDLDQARKARIAVIDILMGLIDPILSGVSLDLVHALISDYMRAITWDRGRFESLYQPEPFLAEAASSLLFSWENGNPDVVIKTVNDVYWRNHVMQLSDANELGVRILLTSAYRQACWRDRRSREDPVIFSEGCKLRTFLKCLFVQANDALKATPDNIRPDELDGTSTLDQALGDAIVRFTSFHPWEDDEPPSQHFLHRALMSNMAILCTRGKHLADVVIPVVVRDKGDACVHVVTALFIGTRNLHRGGLHDALVLDQDWLRFFRENPEPCTCGGSELPPTGRVDLARLPYVSILMDLGKQVETPSRIRAVRADEAARETEERRRSRDVESESSEDSSSTPMDEDPHMEQDEDEEEEEEEDDDDDNDDDEDEDEDEDEVQRPRHPRYSMYVRGCTPELLRGVSSTNVEAFTRLLELSGNDSDHPAARHRRAWMGNMPRTWLYQFVPPPPPPGDEEVFYVVKWGDIFVREDSYCWEDKDRKGKGKEVNQEIEDERDSDRIDEA
ncbi:hypothetical protein BC834DRAFT_885261 [Gloeopeniophorella convolvens]|nr:hypothetical protein BC834DRAFT_885261 [Gloeopeniophorella convolvens]